MFAIISRFHNHRTNLFINTETVIVKYHVLTAMDMTGSHVKSSDDNDQRGRPDLDFPIARETRDRAGGAGGNRRLRIESDGLLHAVHPQFGNPASHVVHRL